MNKKKLKVYAVYHGDEFIAVGTVDELAQLMHTSKLNIRSSIWHNQNKLSKRVEYIEIEDDDDDQVL